MSKYKKVKLQLSSLKETFFVREKMNDEWVLHLAGLDEDGTKLPPLLVVEETNELVDGRHRKAAYLLRNKTEAECELLPNTLTRAELIVTAFSRNTVGADGPLQPSRPDINHTMIQLLEAGMKRKHIVDAICETTPFSASLVRRHLDQVQSHMAAAKMVRAINAVAEGVFSVQDSALHFGVAPEKLKERLKGTRRKRDETSFQTVKPVITSRFKSLSSSNGRTFRLLMEKYEEGAVTIVHVREVIGHIRHHIKSMDHTLDDWERRFIVANDPAPNSNSEVAPKPAPKNGGSINPGKRALEAMGIS